jgi:acetylornithine deacetylase
MTGEAGRAHETRETAAAGLLRRLIAIDSVNPGLVPGAAGEAAAARFAAEWLAGTGGFEVRLLEHDGGRASVLAIARGTGGGRGLMLNGHIDTVALSSYDGDGLGPDERDGNVYGRGSYDMKSGVAAIMVAAAAAAAAPHRGDIAVALVADEEWGSAGTEAVLREVVTEAAIVAEPSNLDLVIAHRGFALAEVTVHGVAAHGSRPDLGVDAIAKSGRFLTALEDLAGRLAAGPPDPLVGTGGVHASIISGGIEYSTYPDRCTVIIERRTVPGEDAATTDAELRAILDGIAAADPAFRFDLAVTAQRPPFAADPQSAVAGTLTAAFRDVTGGEPRRRGEAFWTDCALLGEAGIDTVMFGAAGGGAHAATEWVTLSSLHTVTETLTRTITSYTG